MIVGAKPRISRKSQFVTPETYSVINSLKAYGDFGQHLDGASVSIGTAVTAVLASIELASLLADQFYTLTD